MTTENSSYTISKLHHNSLVMDEIQQALNAGKEVITHTDEVNVPGWAGAGYIMLDPQIGDGAFKIGGGTNGGFLVFGSAAMGVVGMFLFINGIGPAILAGVLLSVAIHAAILGLNELISEGLIDPKNVFAGAAATLSLMRGLSVLLAGLGIVGFTVPGGMLMGIVLVALERLGYGKIGK